MAKFSVIKNVLTSYQVEVEADSVEQAREKAARGEHGRVLPVRNPDWATDANVAPEIWEAIEAEKSGGLFKGHWPSESPTKPEPFVRRNCIPVSA
jgi:hypothetical protein